MDKRWTIYVIRHPETRQPVYVGKTCGPLLRRLGGHLTASRSTHHYLSDAHRLKAWILSLSRDPIIEPLVVNVSREMSRALEMCAVDAYVADGHDMLNMHRY